MVKIVDIDVSRNFYDERRDTIVIDSKLREYPEALEMVVLHELTHAMIENKFSNPFSKLLAHLRHELKADFNYAFSTKEEFVEYRKYDREKQPEKSHAVLIPFVRSVWSIPLYLIMEIRKSHEATTPN